MLKSLGSFVVVVPDPPKTEVSGFFIPEENRATANSGTVFTTGPDCKVLKPGDCIIYGQFSGSIIEIEGATYRIMEEEKVFAIYEKEKEKIV